jgi:hypothetical protein
MKDVDFKTLWYEDEDGNIFVPDLTGNMPPEIPKGFIYQHSRFINNINETIYEDILQSTVDECTHPVANVVSTYGRIDGIVGHKCNRCGGEQTSRGTFVPSPKKWDACGSRQIFSSNSSWSIDLVTAMVRNHGINLEKAIQLASLSCGRCLNVLYSRYAPELDTGYYEFSNQWQNTNTYCDMCEEYGTYNDHKGNIFLPIYQDFCVRISNVNMSEETFENGDGLITFDLDFDDRYLTKYRMAREQVETLVGEKIIKALVEFIENSEEPYDYDLVAVEDSEWDKLIPHKNNNQEVDLSEVVEIYGGIDEIPDLPN